MTVMAPDRAAYARTVYEHIIASPELHKQRYFGETTACGTAHCIAGWAVELDADTDIQWLGIDGYSAMSWFVTVDGQRVRIEDRAAQLLGINLAAAEKLFYDMGEKSALKRFRKWIEKAEATA